LNISSSSQWFIAGASVLGAIHSRQNLPNQDAISWWPESGKELPIVMSVSDGHGGPKSIRSQTGSRLAVQNCIETLKEFAETSNKEKNIRKICERADKEISSRIEMLWKKSVDYHLQQFPFTSQELAVLKKEGAIEPDDSFVENRYLAYGATLLGTMLTETYILYLQLGDGDILNVMADGKVVRPIQEDVRNLGNTTTSLCTNSSANEFRITVQDATSSLTNLILLSTDGYANSFCGESEFFKVGSDLLSIVRSEGIDIIKAQIEGWLLETTRMGSGDDITLGIIGKSLHSL
jgi:hypothetical protein